jgi:hypothetical protein
LAKILAEVHEIKTLAWASYTLPAFDDPAPRPEDQDVDDTLASFGVS